MSQSIDRGHGEDAGGVVVMRADPLRLLESPLFVDAEGFRQIADGIPTLAWMADHTGRAIWYNQRWCGYTGKSIAEIQGSGWQSVVDPDRLPAVAKLWAVSIARGRSFEMEFALRGADGILHDFLTRVSPLMDKEGNVVRWFGASTDVSELTHLRNELRDANEKNRAEALAAKKELEAFAYSVSHDLRAPLRHIDGFTDLLRENCYPSLDSKGQRYLDKITSAAQRLADLIDDLLSLSRLVRSDFSATRVNLQTLQAEVQVEVQTEPRRTIVWLVGELPEIRGDRAMLRQMFVHLLSNALKYTRGRAEARIEIGCAGDSDQETIIFVRDNGVGFEMEYADRLFEVFRRLHSDEFEGNGIGLAAVRRIVERHGGRVWAEGKVDCGATFYCSLPLPERNAGRP
ncbi:MAG: ATP-binding protein [Terriglobia bacterium]